MIRDVVSPLPQRLGNPPGRHPAILLKENTKPLTLLIGDLLKHQTHRAPLLMRNLTALIQQRLQVLDKITHAYSPPYISNSE
jgi:hypothetical protein